MANSGHSYVTCSSAPTRTTRRQAVSSTLQSVRLRFKNIDQVAAHRRLVGIGHGRVREVRRGPDWAPCAPAKRLR